MNLLTLLFSYQGRIGRGQFWLAVLIYVVFVILVAIGITVATDSLIAGIGVAGIAYIPILISSIFVGIKRLHDRNKSAWWLLVFYGLPFVLPFFSPLFGEDDASAGATILQGLSFLVSLWSLVELGIIRGTIGGNPYGPDPVAPKPAHH